MFAVLVVSSWISIVAAFVVGVALSLVMPTVCGGVVTTAIVRARTTS